MSCVADDDGQPCDRDPIMVTPVELCDVHQVQVALAIMPDLLAQQLVDIARPVPTDQLLSGPHSSIVYFIRNGDRVKIGLTGNLRSRLGGLTLRPDSVLLGLDGGRDLEQALHARFATYRHGDTEWFDLSSEISRYMASRRELPLRSARVPRSVRRRAPSSRPPTKAEQVDLLVDVAAVLGDDLRLRTRTLLQRLVDRNADQYSDWTFMRLRRVLTAAGAPPRKSNVMVVDRQDVLDALARLNHPKESR